jgi:hypothetical protein
MQFMKEAGAVRSDDHGEGARGGRPEDAPEKAERRRLTLRHLHGLIEALREEHMKLEMRVDRLSELVERMAAPDAGMRRDAGFAGGRTGEPRLALLPEWTPDAVGAFAGREDEADDRGAASTAAAEDRAAFGFAIWAGVERAIGNAAAMLAAGREDGGVAAELPAGRGQAQPQSAALFRRQRPPEHERREVPIESLLLELREAARIADEIAANASAAEHRAGPAHPARAPDMPGGAAGSDAAGVDAPGGAGAAEPAAAEAVASGGAAAGPPAGLTRPAESAATAAAGPAQPEGAAAFSAAASGPGGQPGAAGSGEPAAAQPSAAQSAGSQLAGVPAQGQPALGQPAPGEPPQSRPRQQAADTPSILIPRSERHRARKKRSLWARLFRRQHAGS